MIPTCYTIPGSYNTLNEYTLISLLIPFLLQSSYTHVIFNSEQYTVTGFSEKISDELQVLSYEDKRERSFTIDLPDFIQEMYSKNR